MLNGLKRYNIMRYDVLFMGESFPMPMGGGSVNYVYRLLSNVSNLSYFVLTGNASPKENVEFDKQFPHKVIRCRHFPHVLKPYNNDKKLKRLIHYCISLVYSLYIIIRYRPRLILLTEFSVLSIPLIIVNVLFGFKIGLFTYAEELTQLQCQNRRVELAVLKVLLRRACGVITVCDYTAGIVCNIFDVSEKIIKIIPPVNTNELDFDAHKLCDKKEVVLLTVARLEERKGHIDVIKAISRLIKQYPNICYNIVGSGPFLKSIEEEIVNYDLSKNIHLLGKVSDEELIKQYKNSDIFVMPHKLLNNGDTEGCPTVFLEAGTYHLPVVGGDAGGVSDAILHNITGFICNHEKEDDLYEYLLRLIEDSRLRDEMGEAGYNYSSKFSAEIQSQKLYAFIDSILKV